MVGIQDVSVQGLGEGGQRLSCKEQFETSLRELECRVVSWKDFERFSSAEPTVLNYTELG